MSLSTTICNQIRMICKERNITSYQIAKNTRISQKTVDQILKGDGPSPRIDTIEKILDYLNVDFMDLIEIQSRENRYNLPEYVLHELDEAWRDSDDYLRNVLVKFLKTFQDK